MIFTIWLPVTLLSTTPPNWTKLTTEFIHGIYKKKVYLPTRSLIKGLAATYIDVAKVKLEELAAFNINDNQPKDKLEQLIYVLLSTNHIPDK